ncbi:MAG: hypothetical protein ACI9SP_004665 [Arenicella sp.]|jgi:hypothetical protein
MKLEPTKKLAEAGQNLVRTSNFLKAEMSYLVAPLRKSNDYVRDAEAVMFSYRSVVRAQISHIEAVCHLMRKMVLSVDEEKLKIVFTDAEILRLQDKKVDRKDSSKHITFFPDSLSNLGFSFGSFAKVFAPNFVLQKSGVGWEHYLVLLRVRNRLTHPKSFDSQMVTGDETESAHIADDWFTKEVNRLLHLAKKENTFLAN